jgi:hypothetical protein
MRDMIRGVLVAVVLSLGAGGALAADVVQTQMGMAGDVEVDVLKAAVQEGILTVVLAYRNTGSKAFTGDVRLEETYYLDDVEKKKFHVLRDSKNEWIAAPIMTHDSGRLGFDVAPGAKRAVWLKFPAPPDKAKTINLVVPGVLPFEKLTVSR